MPRALEALITFTEGENVGSELKVESPRELTIGRSEQCDIFVGEKKVSRKHARLIVKSDGIFIEDLDSTNGTFVDGKRVGSAEISSGSSVRIGMTVFKVDINEVSVAQEESQSESSDIEIEPSEANIPLPNDENSGASEPPKSEVSNADPNDIDLSDELSLVKGNEEDDDSSKADEQKEKKKALSGSLSEMALPDILQMLKNNQRTGLLKIKKGSDSGGVVFVDGNLVTGNIGDVSGLKAIFRMLAFNEGEFELQPIPNDFSMDLVEEKIELGLENILIEGMRQIDELEKVRKQLPSRETKLEINKECSAPLSKLHPKVLDVLQLVIKSGLFGDVMDKSSLPDLETGKIIFYLLKKGYIKQIK